MGTKREHSISEPGSAQDKCNKEQRLIDHYQFIVGQWTEYYKLYMQSWGIFGSAIIAGLMVAIFKPAGQGDGELLNAVMAVMPLFILIWFLLSSFFWSMFQMYSRYASDLEGQIRKHINDEVAYSIFSTDKSYWYQSKKIGLYFVNALTAVFCVVSYVLLACQAASFVNCDFRFVFGGYLVVMIVAVTAIIIFIWSNAKSAAK